MKIKFILTAIFVFGFNLGSFDYASAEVTAFGCTCYSNNAIHSKIGETVILDSEEKCNQQCANLDAPRYIFANGGSNNGIYKIVTKTKSSEPVIPSKAAYVCQCDNGAMSSITNISNFSVSNTSECQQKCLSEGFKRYNFNYLTWFETSPSTAPPAPTSKKFEYTLLEGLPGFFGANQKLTDLPSLILSIYKFGIWTVGIAGLFMLVIGGFIYMASAGNTSTAGNARGIIWDALLGIVAALGAYLILYVINPDLTKVNLNFTAVSVYDVVDISNPTSSTKCLDCVSVVDICKENPCMLNSTLAAKLRAALNGQNGRITEGWPATTNHTSSCHGNGTCADVNLTVNKGDIAEVKRLYDAIRSAGLKPVYEDTVSGCAKYTAASVYCKSYPTMTSPSFHVNM